MFLGNETASFLGNSSSYLPVSCLGVLPGGVVTATDTHQLAKRIDDLSSFGLISALERIALERLMSTGTPDALANATRIIEEKEKKALSKRSKPSLFQKLNQMIPAGWRLDEAKFSNIPNWALYSIIGGVAFLAAKRVKRK